MTDRTITREVTRTRFITRAESPTRVITSNLGLPGEDGEDGDPGAAGPGVPTGGTAGQFLRKQSGTNYDTAWSAPATSEVTGLDAALAAKIPATEKGAANGVASLDGTGKVPTAQLPIAAALGSVTYQGTWNATTNTPTIPAAAVGNKGYYYRVATAGTTTINGVNDWKVGDWIVSDGVIWQKVDNTDPAGVSDVPGLVTALGLKADQAALDSEETDRIAGDAALQAEIDALPGPDSTLLFSTDLRTGYADASALGAAIAAGTHPIFNLSSVFDENFATFDDVVLYEGRGTVRITAGAWLDYLLASPLTDVWVRLVQRYSPTFNTNPPTTGGQEGFTDLAAWDSTAYNNFIVHFAETDDGDNFTDFARVDPVPGEAERTYTLPQLRNGSFRDVVVHFTRNGLDCTVRSWLNGVPGPLVAEATTLGNPDFTLLEPFWIGNKPDEADYDDVNDYVNVALLEAYDGGDPYDLLGSILSNALAPKADQSALDAEASTRSGETTALDGRLDVVEPLTPSSGEKAALAGTSGTPGSGNKYVTDGDARNTNARTPSAHTHPESEVTNLVTDLAGKQPLHANLTAITALVGASDRLAYFTGVGTLSLATFTAFGRTLAALADYAALRTGAGLVIGTDVQAFHANLSALAGLTLIADRLPYANGSGTLALTTFTAAGRALIDDADATAQRATLGLAALAILSTVGTAQIDADAVDNTKLANMANATIKGRTTAGTGDPEDLTATQTRTLLSLVIGTNVQAWSSILDALVAFTSISDGQTVKRSGSSYIGYTPASGALADGDYGDVVVSGTGTVFTVDNDAITTAKILNDNVTYAKLQNISATARLLGRVTSGAGDAEEIALGTGLAFSAGALTCTVVAPSAATASVLGTVKILGTPTDAANPTVMVKEQHPGQARLKVGATAYLTIPGVACTSVNVLSIAADIVYYYPFTVHPLSLTLDSLVCEVTTVGASGKKARMAAYAADTDWQPLALKVQTAEFLIDALGVNTMGSLATPLVPGRYLMAITSNGAPTLRTFSAQHLGANIVMAGSPFIYRWSKARSYAALPDPGVVADTIFQTSTGLGFYPMAMGFTP